ncbi:hypothetical protein SAOR_09680 [Salinisphaera orenii MK-B5]|uniref:Uncharacterized protein n=2 Tax=Salinisphaera TaxID=180541 RepID=A0A423PMY5_9GAMM|nr:hypothetical protein SAOR_09680 [Salinisphaera orenii MK-B5]
MLRVVPHRIGPALLAGLIMVCATSAGAAPPQTISPFVSASLNRTVHGQARDFDLSLAGRNLGHARAFAGLDALSNASQQYLTSGLQWRSDVVGTPVVRMSALRTESRSGELGRSQTLMRAANRLDLGERWFLPTLETEVAQVSNSRMADAPTLGGRAARLALAETFDTQSYRLGFFQADPTFNALGSSVRAGDAGFEVGGSQAVGGDWELSQTLRLHQATALRSQAGLVQEWRLSRNARLTDIGRPWRFSAQVGNPGLGTHAGHAPMALQLLVPTVRVSDWRLDTSVGWYDPVMAAPGGLPVSGSMWRVSATRGLSLGGLSAEVSPRFAVGGSRFDDREYGGRAGFTLGLADRIDRVDLSVDYLSDGWGATPEDDGDVQLMLNYSQSTAALVPRLHSMARALRLPWVPRY